MGISKPRPEYDPTIPVHAVCPGCNGRLGGVIDPDCPICTGSGVITLGRPALTYDTPQAVALAITYTLDSVIDQAARGSIYVDVHREALPMALTRLLDLGILDPPTPAQGGEPCPQTPTRPQLSALPAWSPPKRKRTSQVTPGQLLLFAT